MIYLYVYYVSVQIKICEINVGEYGTCVFGMYIYAELYILVCKLT